MSDCSMASTYLRWLGERGWTMRLTPAERCLPESTRTCRVTAGSATTSLSMPLSSPLWRLTPDLRRVSKSAKMLFDAGDAVGFAGDMDGVGAEIDRDVESVFQQAEVFVVGPVEGLNARGDFEGFFDQVVC